MDKLTVIVQRRKSCQIYRFLSVFQFSAGFLLVFFAAYVAAILHGKNTGAPYYAGAFIAGSAVIILSVFGGVVYHRGKTTKLEILIPLLVKPWVVVYLILSLCATAFCVVGVVITGIYGLCQTDNCSYTLNTDFNLGMAVFLLVLEIICSFSTTISVGICVYYARSYSLHMCFHQVPSPGTVQVKPVVDEVQIAQDMISLQMWRHSMENDVDFRKVAEYLEKSRKHQTGEYIQNR